MALSTATNDTIYGTGAALSKLLLDALAMAGPWIEKCHHLGIPGHAQTPVDGFVNGEADTSDVINMVQVAEEFRTFMNTTNIKRCAMARRNLP